MKNGNIERSDSAAAPFSLADIRNDQDFGEQIGLKYHTAKPQVKRPNKYGFFRTLGPREDWISATVIDTGSAGEIFLVSNNIRDSVIAFCSPVLLVPWIDRDDEICIWPLKRPKEGNSPMGWHTSALDAATRALFHWTQMTANSSASAYDIAAAQGNLPDPQWPDPLDITDLIQKTFADRFIDSLDHPTIRRMRGLA